MINTWNNKILNCLTTFIKGDIMKSIKLFFAWILSFICAPIDIALIWGFDFSFQSLKRARKYNYDVRRAHIMDDQEWFDRNSGKKTDSE